MSRLELTYSEEERVERMSADTSVVKKNHERNTMTQEQKRRAENTKTWKKAKEKHWTPTACVPRD